MPGNLVKKTLGGDLDLGLYYWGSMGIMEKKMEITIMENQMEKKIENEMEAREYCCSMGIMEKKMESSII